MANLRTRFSETVTTLEALVIVGAALSAAGASAWAIAKDWGPAIVPIVFGTLAAGVIIADKVNVYKKKRALSAPKMAKTMRDWLDEGGFKVALTNTWDGL